MSFSALTKNEIARIITEKSCCQKAELAALVKMAGTLQISEGHRLSLTVRTENAAVARKIFLLAKNLFGAKAEITLSRRLRLKKGNYFLVKIPPSSVDREVLISLAVMDKRGSFVEGIPARLVKNDCCRRAYLRGAFLATGSVSKPEGDYHLEILNETYEHATELAHLMANYELTPRVTRRKGNHVLYLKESEEIADFLSLAGAHTALLNFENVRVMKGMRNRINRLVNCETANLDKTVRASVRQREAIEIIDEMMGFSKLPAGLREVAEIRRQYPDANLKELGELLNPPVGKSGVSHRMKRLENIAEKLLSHEERGNRPNDDQ